MTSAIFPRSFEKQYPEASGGSGVYLVCEDGRKVLDGSSGAAVSSLGHGHPEVIESIVNQARGLAFAHTSFFTSRPAEELAALLLEQSDDVFEKVYFVSSGSEAVETALKIARQYHVYNGELDRVNIIGRLHSYHGNTLGALATGNNPDRRAVMAPILGSTFHHVGRCFYTADGAGRSEKEYENGLIEEFEAKIQELGPNSVAAIVVEPVSGATLGSVPPTKNYLPRLRKLCDQHGILLLFDEVMCGMGRVGTYHAWQGLGNVAPDLQTIGKGLGGGYVPLSAILVSPKVVNLFEKSSRGASTFTSGHTFQGHPLGCASALTVQQIIKRDNLIENVRVQGKLLVSILEEFLPNEVWEHSASIRGLGLFQTVDFGTLGTSNGGRLAPDIAKECLARGAAVYPCSSVVDAILIAPPYIISEAEVRKLADIFLESLVAVCMSRG